MPMRFGCPFGFSMYHCGAYFLMACAPWIGRANASIPALRIGVTPPQWYHAPTLPLARLFIYRLPLVAAAVSAKFAPGVPTDQPRQGQDYFPVV